MARRVGGAASWLQLTVAARSCDIQRTITVSANLCDKNIAFPVTAYPLCHQFNVFFLLCEAAVVENVWFILTVT